MSKKVVHKYVLEPGIQHLELPMEIQFLSIEFQPVLTPGHSRAQEVLRVWGLVDPDAATAKYCINVLMTGEPVETNGWEYQHIGSATSARGIVVHAFECWEPHVGPFEGPQ